MEEFLEDYGFKWVGNDLQGDTEAFVQSMGPP